MIRLVLKWQPKKIPCNYLGRYSSHIFLAAWLNHYWYIIETMLSVYGKNFYRFILFHLFLYYDIFVEFKCLNSLYWVVFTDKLYVEKTASSFGLVLFFLSKEGGTRLVKVWFLRSLLLLLLLLTSRLLIPLTTSL